MEKLNELLIKVERPDSCQDDQLILVKREKAELSKPSPSQNTDTTALKIEHGQPQFKSEPLIQNNLIDDVLEDISSDEENDKLEDISDDDDEDDNFEEAHISKDSPSKSSTRDETDNNVNIAFLPNGYYNPLTRNQEDLQYLITTLKEDPKMNACSYCWRTGHLKVKCNDKLWYGELNKKCPIWVEGCSKRKQIYYEMKPEALEKEIERKKMKQKRNKMKKKFEATQPTSHIGEESQLSLTTLPPGDEFEVVEELKSSDEEEEGEQTEKLPPAISNVTDSARANENLMLKNEEDLNYLIRSLTEVPSPSKNTCNYCCRAGHIKRDCDDRRISSGIKLCPIWKEGLGKRRQAFLELSEGASERIREKRRKANQRHKVTRKAKKFKRMEVELERKEMEEKIRREKLEDEEKRRKIEAAEMLLEIVNELLE